MVLPLRAGRETRRLLRGSQPRPWFLRRNHQAGLENRLRLARLGVTSTGHIPGDQAGALAAELIAAARQAADAAARGARPQEEVWLAEAHIVGRLWLAVRLLEEGTGLPDEDHTDRVRHARRILDELRALAEPATRG
ncbi:hypothetical protein [Streptomyces sp. MN13]